VKVDEWQKAIAKIAEGLRREIRAEMFSYPARDFEVDVWNRIKGKERIFINLFDRRGEPAGEVMVECYQGTIQVHKSGLSYNTDMEISRALREVLPQIEG
jgi:hypothetical protein